VTEVKKMLRSYDEGTHIAESSMDATVLLALYGTFVLLFQVAIVD
jgi:hypothetical protein